MIAIPTFIILISNTQTETLEVNRTLNENWRGTYDLLIRPQSALNPLEKTQNLVRPLFQSETYGGITLQNLKDIKSIPGIQIAAPVMNLGTLVQHSVYEKDISPEIDASQPQMLRSTVKERTRNRPFKNTLDQPLYQFFTPNPLPDPTQTGSFSKYQHVPDAETNFKENDSYVFAMGHEHAPSHDLNLPAGKTKLFLQGLPLLGNWIAVDPEAEAQLYHLDNAVTDGQYLTVGQADTELAGLVVKTQGPIDFQYQITTEILDPQLAQAWQAQGATPDLIGQLPQSKSIKTLNLQVPANDTWTQELERKNRPQNGAPYLNATSIFQPGPVKYQQSGNTLQARKVPANSQVFHTLGSAYAFSSLADDSGFRPVPNGWLKLSNPSEPDEAPRIKIAGIFDPTRLSKNSQAEVPLGLYQQPQIKAADQTTRQALNSDFLYPDLNPIGYQLPPVSVITDLQATLQYLPEDSALKAAPISSVRVKTSITGGVNEKTLEQLRLIAKQIEQKTGLRTDITVGSAKTNQLVHLPASDLGVPALNLEEIWAQKGVVLAIKQAHDQKSILLAALILTVALLTTVMVAVSQVRAQYVTLRTLSLIGWRAGQIRRHLLKKWALQGLLAGALGAILTYPLAKVLKLNLNPYLPILALPLTLALTLLAGWVASRQATRPNLGANSTPTMQTTRRFTAPRARRSQNSQGQDVSGLKQGSGSGYAQSDLKLRQSPYRVGVGRFYLRPGRALISVVNISLAVSALAVILWLGADFNGTLIGNYLGQMVELQVRHSDRVAVVFMVLLAAISVGTMTWLNNLEDRSVYGILATVGWSRMMVLKARLAASVTASFWGGILGGATSLSLAYLLQGYISGPVLTQTLWSVLAVSAASIAGSLLVKSPRQQIHHLQER
ncbi:hypothetical protein BSR29_01315 [Boudabousia liubingyangii]|uniref:ABC3 transporter permease C-terminal domain-containing protein n=1 Tax=Boudabousia liubingyangii TaxID=1921764 RepID=A0A1Q5PQC8_9ACTO|nr:hypothetical protein BSR28_01165 [Boudabousia liubingyangii]OKL49625.1 hypothetical protein BSR29_01315 [Boudabousia liubingyangii]